MTTLKKYLIVGGVAVGIGLLGYGIGRFTTPSKIVEVEKIKVVTVEAQHQNTNADVTTVVVAKPDGTTTTTTTDHSTHTTDTNTSTVATDDHSKTTTYSKPNWRIAALAGADASTSTIGLVKPIYGGCVERRLFWNISVGAWGLSNKTFGGMVSMEF